MKRPTLALAALLSCAGTSAVVAGSYVQFGPGGVVFGYGAGYAPAGYAPTVPCRYPDGWNAGDAAQDFRGVPVGMNHRCRVTRNGVVVDRDGDPTQ